VPSTIGKKFAVLFHVVKNVKLKSGIMAQVVECLPSKWEALNSKPTSNNNKKRTTPPPKKRILNLLKTNDTNIKLT
jgi:hypothetical protein